MKLFTIGFTKHSAESFFTKLRQAGVKCVRDTRYNNSSQLSGFAKKEDLKYFLKQINKCDYSHSLELAPTQEILHDLRSGVIDWGTYSKKFLQLMKKRHVEEIFTPEELDSNCLLCSEYLPHQCHRRLVAEYLQTKWKNVQIIHL